MPCLSSQVLGCNFLPLRFWLPCSLGKILLQCYTRPAIDEWDPEIKVMITANRSFSEQAWEKLRSKVKTWIYRSNLSWPFITNTQTIASSPLELYCTSESWTFYQDYSTVGGAGFRSNQSEASYAITLLL